MNGRKRSEWELSQRPAGELLARLGYTELTPVQVRAARTGSRTLVLETVLSDALRYLNPWLNDENVTKVVRAVTAPGALSLIEANEALYTLITRGMSVQQDVSGRPQPSQTVRFIDFEDVDNNVFNFAYEVPVRGRGAPGPDDAGTDAVTPTDADTDARDAEDRVAGRVRFDLVVFVNGLPLALGECKSPTLEQPLSDAVDQLVRYQELDDFHTGAGAPRAFEAVQLVVALARDTARYATVLTPERYFVPFPDAYPPLPPVGGLFKLITAQDVLIYSLLRPESLLEFVRNLTVFEVQRGRTVRKVARHPQRIAIDRAAQRVQRGKDALERSGVVWHTQGSGKSLTMIWLAQRLRDPRLGLQNPTLVIVTDRTDLDQQLAGTFRRVGFPNPQQAASSAELRRLLRKGNGLTILTTVQKFYDATGEGSLNPDPNVFVMVDEAHRSQYSSLAARMRASLPNASYFAFTGTPVDKREKSTLREFGSYIHTYTLEESVRDGATIPIYYEGRELKHLRLEGESLDERVDLALTQYPEEQRGSIKAKFKDFEIVAAAPRRIEEIAWDIRKHYLEFIRPNGFKAQVVAVTREAAARYGEALSKFDDMPESRVIFSSYPGDSAALKKHHTTKGERKALIERFKDEHDPLSMLIVVDMLLTGFDAPVEQVLYLDAPLREHNLLQAIARVNRVTDAKEYGLIVDYWGVSEHLEEALSAFDTRELGVPMRPKDDVLVTLEATHREAVRMFNGLGRDDIDALVRHLEPHDRRTRFNDAYRAFSGSLNLMYPDPRSLKFEQDLIWLSVIRREAWRRYRDETLGLGGLAQKVRGIIEKEVTASGVTQLVAPVPILSSEFEARMSQLGSDGARASEIAYAIKHEITVRESENPAFYRSLRERLDEVIRLRLERRLSEAEQLKYLFPLRDELKAVKDAAERLGLNPSEYAFYKLLEEKVGAAVKPEVARALESAIRSEIVVDWTVKDDVKRRIRRNLRRTLMKQGLTRDEAEPLVLELLDTAAARMAYE